MYTTKMLLQFALQGIKENESELAVVAMAAELPATVGRAAVIVLFDGDTRVGEYVLSVRSTDGTDYNDP